MTTETQMQTQTQTQTTFDWKAAPVRSLDTEQIRKLLPHRYPFLFVDRADVLEEGKRAVGYKCVSVNEGFFQGHFPDFPIMPGVLIVEAMAQTAIVLMAAKGGMEGKIGLFLGIEEAKFRQPVKPGAVLEMRVEMLRAGSRAGKVRGEAWVGGQLAAESTMSFAIVDKNA